MLSKNDYQLPDCRRSGHNPANPISNSLSAEGMTDSYIGGPELNASAMAFQLPSGCLVKTGRYFPLSVMGFLVFGSVMV
jgi:hypothetical protein